MLLIEICKEKRSELRLSNGQISERSGIPLSTVNSFFAGAVKSPTLLTVGPICKVLGVSLDGFFGIVNQDMSAQEVARVREEYEQNRVELQKVIESHAGQLTQNAETLAHKNEIISRQDSEITGLKDRIHKQCTAIIIHRILIFSFAAWAMIASWLLLR